MLLLGIFWSSQLRLGQGIIIYLDHDRLVTCSLSVRIWHTFGNNMIETFLLNHVSGSAW